MPRSAARRIEKTPEAYRSIGEASDELGLQPHVLRYWETKFPKLVKPLKRRDGRRMFRSQDLQALRAIQLLVHDKGMTLKGAEKLLNAQGVERVLCGDARLDTESSQTRDERLSDSPARAYQRSVQRAFEIDQKAQASGRKLETVLTDLTALKQRIDKARLRNAA